MGRNAQPVSVIMMNGKSHHLTKAEIKRREESKVNIGTETVEVPEYVELDKQALKQWNKLINDYELAKEKGHEIITSTDADILGKYCVTHAEYLSLKKKLQIINNIDLTELEEEIYESRDLSKETKKKLNQLLNIDYTLKLESAINKKHEILIKLEDRLFLNPLSKIKNIAKEEKKKPKNPMEDEFSL
jgi:phage terminase small subunit